MVPEFKDLKKRQTEMIFLNTSLQNKQLFLNYKKIFLFLVRSFKFYPTPPKKSYQRNDIQYRNTLLIAILK